MHANMSNMNKYDYNHTKNQMLYTKTLLLVKVKQDNT